MFAPDLLFSSADIDREIDTRRRRLLYEIEHVEPDDILGTSVEDWCDYFESKFAFAVPNLLEVGITVEQTEEDENLLRHNRRLDAREQPVVVRITIITYHVPFEGDEKLFRFRPTTYTLSPPRACLASGELQLPYVHQDHEPRPVKDRFAEDLDDIRSWLGWLEESVRRFNREIRDIIHRRVEERRARVLKDRELVASLGFPLRHADQGRGTYIIDGPRKKLTPKRPSASRAPFVPEPELSDEQYSLILSTIEHMVAVMERSPKAFEGMGEEELRQHLLVGLNASFEGKATGETFNFEGKTDILIRDEGKNLFIGECKIWKGQKKLLEAIDQILGYASWRDTKTAIILFNRNRDFSSVVAKIPETVETHPNFKRRLDGDHETRYRCVIHHRDDVNRELVLTVMAFEVPTTR